ncbi:putative cyclin-D6-1 [Magnolia sinica]|uniref:putative cyclin-D6-1 n=1 Tax=Magnolia sinica TaxID=86752 RepID=UPI00265ADE3B|nr:putative cyclin-D6-1 [Magnolia sinica]
MELNLEPLGLATLKNTNVITIILSISYISLASKMKKSTFSLTSFQSEEGIIFDTQAIQRMELLILGVLKWRIRSVTPFAFLLFFLSFFKQNDPPLKQALKAMATEIVFKAQNEVKILEHKPSESLLQHYSLLPTSFPPLQFPCFQKGISSCVYINKEKLLDCYNLMQGVVMDGYESILLDEVWSLETPVNVLDRHSLSLESKKTSRISIGCAITRSEAWIKKRKIMRYYEKIDLLDFFHLARKMQEIGIQRRKEGTDL